VVKLVVIDTNVLISSIFWEHGNPHRVVGKASERKIENHTSLDMLKELQKVLKMDFNQPDEAVQRQTALVISYSEIVYPKEKVNVVKEDPKDNMVLECAIACKADYIITGDKHLLKLKEFRSIKIVKPSYFFHHL